jgi:hypothetical protein
MALANQTGPADFSTLIMWTRGSIRNHNPSLFLMDSWEIHPRMTLNTGLRWTRENIYESRGRLWQQIKNELQPRLGFVWRPSAAVGDKWFASYGRYYQEIVMFTPTNFALENNGGAYTSFDHDPRLNPTNGQVTVIAIPVQPTVPNLQGQYEDEFSLGYERPLGAGWSLAVQGRYRTLGMALDEGFSDVYGNFYFGNPGRGLLNLYPKPQRDYRSLQFFLRKSDTGPLSVYVSYVLSKNFGNYPGVSDQDRGYTTANSTSPFDRPELVPNSTGLLPNDRRHVAKASGSYHFGFGLCVGLTGSWQSGTPLSELGAIPQATYWSAFLRPRGSAGRMPSLWDLNARAGYDLGKLMKLSWGARLIADLFHIGSRRTGVGYDQKRFFNVDENGQQINLNPFYRQAIRFQPPMGIRLGMEVEF